MEHLAVPPHTSSHTTPVSPDTQKVLQKLRKLASDAIDENTKSLHNSCNSIRRSYWTLFVMYCVMFTVSIATAIVAIIKGFTASSATDTYSTLIFAGLSAGSFFTLFITRPLKVVFDSPICYHSRLCCIFRDPANKSINEKVRISTSN